MLLMHGLPGLRPRHTWPEYSAYRRLGTTQSSLVLACNDLPSTLQLTRRCCHFAPDLPLISARLQYTPQKKEKPAPSSRLTLPFIYQHIRCIRVDQHPV